MSFDISKVRHYASVYGWAEVQWNPQSRVLGFERNGQERINVYYTTGTVGTCTDHPRLGKTQLFRRNVSYAQLEDLFGNVRTHTGKGYHQKADLHAPDPTEQLPTLSVSWWCTTNNGMNDLIQGNRVCPEEYPIMVLGQTWLGIHHDGRAAWGPGIPKFLDNKLRGRQNWLPTVDVVSLGYEGDNYFVQFADGQMEWAGIPDELSRFLSEESNKGTSVQTIALGGNDSYYLTGTCCVELVHLLNIIASGRTVALAGQISPVSFTTN